MEETVQQEVTSLFSNTQKKILLVVVAGLFIIASIIFILLSFAQKSKESSEQALVTPTPVPQRSLSQKAKPAPVVSFASYTNQATLPIIPPSLKQYTLKTNFSLEEVQQFAKQFGLTAYKPTIQKEIVFYSEEKNTRGYLLFNKDTGIFSYQSWGILTPTTIGATPTATALSFLKQLSIADDTVSCSITYKRKILPQDLTFVECHRIPEKLGTILVNPAGILNLSENTPLSSLKVGYAGANSPVDKDIYNSNIGEDGKARPNDFNTITVGVFPDGRIFSVDSTMRWIKQTTPITTILSPQEALDNFKQHKASFSLTIPAGVGKLNWDTVYPNNKAEAEEASITDYRLVYIEKPLTTTQTSYEPYYLIRGTTRLKTGYMVRFVQTVPAVNTNVLGESTLKMKPFYPPTTNTPAPKQASATVTSTVLVPTSSVSPAPTASQIGTTEEFTKCEATGSKQKSQNEFVIYVPLYGNIVIASYISAPNTYYLKSSSFALKDMNNWLKELKKAYQENPKSFYGVETFVYWLNLHGFIIDPYGISSSCYVSGTSPALFLYNTKSMQATIQPVPFTSYSQPALSHAIWDVYIHNNNLYVDNALSDYLYYEYDSLTVTFTKPQEGYIVKKDAWEKIATQIADMFGVNEKEKKALFTDIQNVLPKITTPFMKISIVNEQEVTQKLPLTISPIPDSIRRIHLLLSPKQKTSTTLAPILYPIVRNGFTVVEVGVAVGK